MKKDHHEETDAMKEAMRFLQSDSIKGREQAIEHARSGRLISAIKELEALNPGLSREMAKLVVRALGYGHGGRWPEPDARPTRCL